jgi:hypothetical protein
MRLIVISAALLLAGSPVIASPEPAAPVAAPAKDAAAKKSNFDMAQMMAVFDKIFPAQPDPLPARLALSRTAVKSLLPDGAYARMVSAMMNGMVNRAMGLTAADFGKTADKGKPADTLTVRQKAMKKDPYFDERMRITERVLGEEFAKMAATIEPKLRDGLARSMARRFDEKQLTDINAFLATDSGAAFGSQSMALWIDPDVLRALMTSLPQAMTAMPAAMKRVEAETAHLPKPKKDISAKADAAKPAS